MFLGKPVNPPSLEIAKAQDCNLMSDITWLQNMLNLQNKSNIIRQYVDSADQNIYSPAVKQSLYFGSTCSSVE